VQGHRRRGEGPLLERPQRVRIDLVQARLQLLDLADHLARHRIELEVPEARDHAVDLAGERRGLDCEGVHHAGQGGGGVGQLGLQIGDRQLVQRGLELGENLIDRGAHGGQVDAVDGLLHGVQRRLDGGHERLPGIAAELADLLADRAQGAFQAAADPGQVQAFDRRLDGVEETEDLGLPAAEPQLAEPAGQLSQLRLDALDEPLGADRGEDGVEPLEGGQDPGLDVVQARDLNRRDGLDGGAEVGRETAEVDLAQGAAQTVEGRRHAAREALERRADRRQTVEDRPVAGLGVQVEAGEQLRRALELEREGARLEPHVDARLQARHLAEMPQQSVDVEHGLGEQSARQAEEAPGQEVRELRRVVRKVGGERLEGLREVEDRLQALRVEDAVAHGGEAGQEILRQRGDLLQQDVLEVARLAGGEDQLPHRAAGHAVADLGHPLPDGLDGPVEVDVHRGAGAAEKPLQRLEEGGWIGRDRSEQAAQPLRQISQKVRRRGRDAVHRGLEVHRRGVAQAHRHGDLRKLVEEAGHCFPPGPTRAPRSGRSGSP
jgi:hypothetical protein